MSCRSTQHLVSNGYDQIDKLVLYPSLQNKIFRCNDLELHKELDPDVTFNENNDITCISFTLESMCRYGTHDNEKSKRNCCSIS